jgi:hypothetical protein
VAASDWWSLGMIVLEQATAGSCFSGVNEKAFQIHVITRGIELPDNLDPTVSLLLRGLLARDPVKRWSWPQVQAWLVGEPVDAPTIELRGKTYTRPENFALAAAVAQNWQDARELMLHGAVATWLEERNTDPKITAQVRRLTSDEKLEEDFRFALALMALNPSLPLSLGGDIVTPAWLLQHPEQGMPSSRVSQAVISNA